MSAFDTRSTDSPQRESRGNVDFKTFFVVYVIYFLLIEDRVFKRLTSSACFSCLCLQTIAIAGVHQHTW